MNILSSDRATPLPFARVSTEPDPGVQPLLEVDPLRYPDWDALISSRPESPVFHGSAWARVMVETYGHCPIYFCRTAGARLVELLPVMEVCSRWTGRRGVSLPFTDFSAPLQSHGYDFRDLFLKAIDAGKRRGWRYFECRGGDYRSFGASPSVAFHGHVVELGSGEDALFKSLDSAVRRGIRKAEQAGLSAEFSTELEAMCTFYSLHCQTRRKHGLPPQPFRFFENIWRHLLQSDEGFVGLTRLNSRPIAAAVFLHAGSEAIYKFGASDYAFQNLRPNNLLMWEGIKRCSAKGFKTLHLGRTSMANEGLRRFKLSLGAREEKIEYFKYSFDKRAFVTDTDRAEGWFNRVFGALPLPLLRLAGQMLYPHLS